MRNTGMHLHEIIDRIRIATRQNLFDDRPGCCLGIIVDHYHSNTVGRKVFLLPELEQQTL
ncbi:MAG: hypothetical protein BGO61_02440 [Thiobacillus sp. 65-69]|nr:MAG: hypothetical protein ABT21_10650 [Thiobacillus sp. SCN 65-179]OJW36542.1 MAG: hypothetical protein BGO61_02440 [Thiobacillus sp. 65-69]